MAKWKIWYEDGSTYSDQDGTIYNAPSWGVQFVAVEDAEHGRIIMGNAPAFDYYWWSKKYQTWLGGDGDGLRDYLAQGHRDTRVLFGRMMETTAYRELKKVVDADDYLPRKSAISGIEQKPAKL